MKALFKAKLISTDYNTMNYNDTHKQSDRNTDNTNDGDIQRHQTDESIGSGDTQESQCAYKENEKKHGGEKENAMKIR